MVKWQKMVNWKRWEKMSNCSVDYEKANTLALKSEGSWVVPKAPNFLLRDCRVVKVGVMVPKLGK